MIRGKYKHIGFAFHKTIPVMLGYLFLGMAFGLLLQNAGYSFLWAFLSSLIIYAGSMQFVLVTLLTGGVSLIHTALMTLFINGRHIFYGLSFVEKYKKMGKAYPYLVFSLTDETYSVLCGTHVPEDMDEKKVFFWISFLDQCYWVLGSTLGGLAGQYITFDSTGIDFSMTALFVVIVIEQWQEKEAHISAIIGAVCGIVFLLIFGADRFILPALLCAMMALIIMNKAKKS
ncbi:MAG: branched-chain amino acid ABC transporter permease [Lachnospiraceae bacterium]|nr:branched-chain amino acid ABC transporter permease [Lachnospiraceae bacterium]